MTQDEVDYWKSLGFECYLQAKYTLVYKKKFDKKVVLMCLDDILNEFNNLKPEK